LTTASQQLPVAAAVAACLAAALETPVERNATETANAASAGLVQIRLARIIDLVPTSNRSARRTLSAASWISLSNGGVLAVMPM
jgi:hypothetical protein